MPFWTTKTHTSASQAPEPAAAVEALSARIPAVEALSARIQALEASVSLCLASAKRIEALITMALSPTTRKLAELQAPKPQLDPRFSASG